MKFRDFFWKRLLVCSLVLGCLLLPHSSLGVEPAREFLNGLRQRGYHELAQEYLNQMKTSAMIPPELKEVILYEQGLTLVEAARGQRDLTLREKQLNQAQASFDEFITKRKGHPLTFAARSQMGNIVVERARMRLTTADRAKTAEEKTQKRQEAQGLFREAAGVFESNLQTIRTRLESMPPGKLDPRKDAELIKQRDQFRADYVQAQLVSATILYEMAATLKGNKEEYQKVLKEAAGKYNDVAEKYRRMLAGFFAKMFEGRCHQDLGDYEQALTLYEELLQLPDESEAFRSLKTKSLKLAMECWITPKIKQYDKAIELGDKWADTARPVEERESDWLALKLLLAKAYKLKADTAKDATAKRRAISDARKRAKEAARYKSEYQKEANELLAQLGVGSATPDEKPEPKNFAQALDAGREALTTMQTAATTVRLLERKIKTAKAEDRDKMQQQVDEANAQIDRSRLDAYESFRLAQGLFDKGDPVNDLNDTRYFLAYLSYQREEYYDAALASEFIAARFPGHSFARNSAKIALASYLKLYNEAADDARQFEMAQLTRVADFISRNWPDQKEADEALITLVNLMVRQGLLDDAQKYLEKIPLTSPRRGEAELKTGQALWSNYLKGMQAIRDAAEGQTNLPDEATLEQMKLRAQKTLADGVERMKSGELDSTLLRAVLGLSQIYVDTDQPAAALELLVDPAVGPKTLVDKKDPLTQVEGFAEETYKAALRAYIGALPTSDDPNSMIERAIGVMDSLKATVGDTEEGKKKLISIYVSLARELEQQMKISTPEVKQALSQGFEMFLKRAGQTATEFNVLNWVAETFYSLGKGFDEGTGTLSPQAAKYYSQALEMYQTILSKKDELALDDQIASQVQMRMAMTRRRMGQFEQALDMFFAILSEKQAMLNVQVEAAMTLQQWAAAGNDAELYAKAIKGDRMDAKTRKNVVWGWGKLAQMTSRYPQYRDTFHEARYNLAASRYQYALRKKPPDRQKYLTMAKNDISVTYRLYPKLGERRDDYDRLLKQVQQSLGEEPAGLQGLETGAQAKAG